MILKQVQHLLRGVVVLTAVISGHSLEEHKCLFIFYTHVVYILYYIQYGEKTRVESMCL